MSGAAARATEPPSTPRATARPPCLQESYALPSATLYRAQLAPEHSGTSRMTGTRSETNATGHTTTRPAPQRPGNHDRLPERGRGQLRSSATRPQRRAARHRAAALDLWGNPSLLRQRPDTGTQWGYQAVTISLTGAGQPPKARALSGSRWCWVLPGGERVNGTVGAPSLRRVKSREQRGPERVLVCTAVFPAGLPREGTRVPVRPRE